MCLDWYSDETEVKHEKQKLMVVESHTCPHKINAISPSNGNSNCKEINGQGCGSEMNGKRSNLNNNNNNTWTHCNMMHERKAVINKSWKEKDERTGKQREESCMKIRTNGSQPLLVVLPALTGEDPSR